MINIFDFILRSSNHVLEIGKGGITKRRTPLELRIIVIIVTVVIVVIIVIIVIVVIAKDIFSDIIVAINLAITIYYKETQSGFVSYYVCMLVC